MSLLLNLVLRLHGALLLRYSVKNYRRAKFRIQDFRNDLRFRSVPHEHNLCPQRSNINLFWTCFSNVSSFSWWVFLFVMRLRFRRGVLGLRFRNSLTCCYIFLANSNQAGLNSSDRDPLTDYFRLKSIPILFTDCFQLISSGSIQIQTRPKRLRGSLLSPLVFIVQKPSFKHIFQ